MTTLPPKANLPSLALRVHGSQRTNPVAHSGRTKQYLQNGLEGVRQGESACANDKCIPCGVAVSRALRASAQTEAGDRASLGVQHPSNALVTAPRCRAHAQLTL